ADRTQNGGGELAGLPLPFLYHPRAGGGQVQAVGAEGHTFEPTDVVLEGEQDLARLRVPDLHRPVPAGAGEPPAVGAEGHAANLDGVCPEGKKVLAGRRVPDLHRLVLAGTGQAPAVGAKRYADDLLGMPG